MTWEIEQTDHYKRWFAKLKDEDAKARIDMRLRRLRKGNPGDVKSVGRGVYELRIDYGPGYRVYYMRKGAQVLLLLIGGDKRRQSGDILLAIKIAEAERNTQ